MSLSYVDKYILAVIKQNKIKKKRITASIPNKLLQTSVLCSFYGGSIMSTFKGNFSSLGHRPVSPAFFFCSTLMAKFVDAAHAMMVIVVSDDNGDDEGRARGIDTGSDNQRQRRQRP